MQNSAVASIVIQHQEEHHLFVCSGNWSIETISAVAAKLDAFRPRGAIRWDLTAISQIDSAGIALIELSYRQFEAKGFPSEMVGSSEKHKRLFQLLYARPYSEPLAPEQNSWIYRIGRESYRWGAEIFRFFHFFGELFLVLLHSLRHPTTIRYRSVVSHIFTSGVTALPIIAISAFLIGVVVAFQSIVQLQKFGADIFIVDMIGISLSRELAPLITAIVVAGRSGSAYTAQIGAMKMTQEIDAMKTMGFHPFLFLVWPRIFALMIVMPLLIFFADIVGIAGGMLIASAQANLSFIEFIHRLQIALPLKHLVIGIVKGPFFAFLIVIASSFRGFQVSSNTESIGRYTTKSVVNSIFLVIACDALFSIILTEYKL